MTMPELPEVESVASALRDHLQGRRCTGVRVRFGGVLEPSAAAVRRAMRGRVLAGVERHGKYLVLGFDDPGPTFVMLHLRMTGQVFVLDGYRPDQHVHMILDFEGQPVHYRDVRKFGRWRVVGPDWRQTELPHVGPDMLAVKLRDWLARVEHRKAPIKAVLLDQGVAAGLGNIYVDESLFRAGVHPLARPADLSRETLARVLREARAVLRLAINHGGTTFLDFTDFHGQPGNFRRKLRVYGRTGEACRRCGETIERSIVGGRSTHACPRCQATGRPGR
jgi:formamidopyrimidine-DNA glycosylase